MVVATAEALKTYPPRTIYLQFDDYGEPDTWHSKRANSNDAKYILLESVPTKEENGKE